jgi:hypothetical protein
MPRNVHADLMIQAANDTSIKWDFSRDGATWTGTASPTWLVELQYRQKPQSQQEMKDAQSTVNSITAALAQPEPSPVLTMPSSYTEKLKTLFGQDRREAWVVAIENENFSDFPDTKYAASFAHDYFIEGWEAAVTKYAAPPAPDTYRHPADDAALKRSFDAMQNGIVAELRKELADMTAHQDKLVGIWQSLADSYAKHCKETKADRLDAQRWQFFLTAQDETTPENAAFASAANALYPDNDLSKVMALAIDKVTGGQP